MTDTIPNVPRELLERAATSIEQRMCIQCEGVPCCMPESLNTLSDIRALLSATSPDGVDGLKRYEVFPYLDDEVAEIDICESDDGSFVKYEDAQAIIDGLRGEVAQLQSMLATVSKAGIRVRTDRDQQAQRIGELEGLLLRVQVSLSLDDTEWGYSGAEKYKLLADIRAALSAGKEG